MFADFEYYARTGGLPFAHQLTAEFTVIPDGPTTKLRVVQDGFPGDKGLMIFMRPAKWLARDVRWDQEYLDSR